MRTVLVRPSEGREMVEVDGASDVCVEGRSPCDSWSKLGMTGQRAYLRKQRGLSAIWWADEEDSWRPSTFRLFSGRKD